jgi:hypothetical protein
MEDQLEQAVTIAIQGTGDDALKQQVRNSVNMISMFRVLTSLGY